MSNLYIIISKIDIDIDIEKVTRKTLKKLRTSLENYIYNVYFRTTDVSKITILMDKYHIDIDAKLEDLENENPLNYLQYQMKIGNRPTRELIGFLIHNGININYAENITYQYITEMREINIQLLSDLFYFGLNKTFAFLYLFSDVTIWNYNDLSIFQVDHIINFLIEHGADINISSFDDTRNNVLFSLVDNIYDDYEDDFTVLTQLIKHGANPNHKNIYGNTPLHQACKNESPKSVKLLLQYGADPTITNNKGKKALHLFRKTDPEYKVLEEIMERIIVARLYARSISLGARIERTRLLEHIKLYKLFSQ